jgi:hypothetical protein
MEGSENEEIVFRGATTTPPWYDECVHRTTEVLEGRHTRVRSFGVRRGIMERMTGGSARPIAVTPFYRTPDGERTRVLLEYDDITGVSRGAVPAVNGTFALSWADGQRMHPTFEIAATYANVFVAP